MGTPKWVRRRRRAALWIFLVLLAALQLLRPDLGGPASDPSATLLVHLQPEAPVAALLQRSCDDCHGVAAKWPWYAQVVPASWLIAYDVDEAKEYVDFTRWASYPPAQQRALLEEMCDEARRGKMPLGRYLWLHKEARLSPADLELLCAWTEREREKLSAPAAPGAPASPPGL